MPLIHGKERRAPGPPFFASIASEKQSRPADPLVHSHGTDLPTLGLGAQSRCLILSSEVSWRRELKSQAVVRANHGSHSGGIHGEHERFRSGQLVTLTDYLTHRVGSTGRKGRASIESRRNRMRADS